MSEITRSEHMNWCKERALVELEHSGPASAIASMKSDFSKHPSTANNPSLDMMVTIAMVQLMQGQFNKQKAKEWVEGFA